MSAGSPGSLPVAKSAAAPTTDVAAPGTLFVLGLSHRSAPESLRERLSLDAARAAHLAASLAAEPALAESLVLSTCNRLEVYAVAQEPGARPRVADALASSLGLPAETLAEAVAGGEEVDAAAHLFSVASGLESQLLGETEILGQLKASYDDAQKRGTCGKRLHKLLQKAFQAAKLVRNETGIARGQVSIGNVAVELAARIFGQLGAARILVVGSGEVGALAAKAFHSRGASPPIVASRNPANAAALAAEVGGTTVEFAEWKQVAATADVVLTATSAGEILLTAAELGPRLRARSGRPLFLIDLAVPRNLDPGLSALADVYLYTLDDLAQIARENLAAREAEVLRARDLIRARARAALGLRD